MPPSVPISRRAILLTGASAPLATLLPTTAAAEAPMMEQSFPTHYRFSLGEFEVTTLLAATSLREAPHETYGLNASGDEFAAVSMANFIPADRAQNFMVPTLVNTGETLVLFDAGMTAEGITGALKAAGYQPEQIDMVVFTHLHADHINGIVSDAGPTFPNAAYKVGQTEFDYWEGAGNENFDRVIRPRADKFSFFGDGDEVVPGITAMAAFGHTPGHMTYMIDSGGQRLLVAGDLANHAVWSIGQPDWHVTFDMDKEAAVESRRRVLSMLAEERLPFVGYHLTFPAIGYVAPEEDRFRFVPVSYQLMLAS